MKSSWIFFISGLMLATACTPYADASLQRKDKEKEEIQINQLSKKIIKDEIELDTLVSQTHLDNDIADIKKRRRQFLWAVINSGATEAGLIDATQLFFLHSGYKYKYGLKLQNIVSGGANAGQLYPQIIGQEINAAGNAFELTYNFFFRYKTKRHKLDPKQSLMRAQRIISRLDGELSERRTMLNNIDDESECRPLFEAEDQVLHDIRNTLLSEYMRVYKGARREFAWQNSMEFLDLTRNVVGAIGNQISVQAGYTHNNHLNGLGNLLSIISAVGITTRPVISLMVAKANARLADGAIRKYLPSVESSWKENMQTDINKLGKLTNENEVNSGNDLVLSVHGRLMEPQQELAKQEESGFNRRLRWQVTRNGIYGPTKIANSTLGTIAGYDGHLDATRRNQLGAAGNLTYTVGQGVNFIELWRERFKDEKETHKLEITGKSPRQILRKRLGSLDELANELKQ